MREFKTTTTRDKIKIDGVAYDLISFKEMNLKDHFWIQKQGERVTNLKDEDFESEEKIEELAKTIDNVVAKLLKAPDEIRGKLTDAQKLEIIYFFLTRKQEMKQQEMRQRKRWSLFRGSKDSTAAAPGNG